MFSFLSQSSCAGFNDLSVEKGKDEEDAEGESLISLALKWFASQPEGDHCLALRSHFTKERRVILFSSRGPISVVMTLKEKSTFLRWYSSDEAPKTSHLRYFINLKSLRRVQRGKSTRNFSHEESCEFLDEHCMSLIFPSMTLDIAMLVSPTISQLRATLEKHVIQQQATSLKCSEVIQSATATSSINILTLQSNTLALAVQIALFLKEEVLEISAEAVDTANSILRLQHDVNAIKYQREHKLIELKEAGNLVLSTKLVTEIDSALLKKRMVETEIKSLREKEALIDMNFEISKLNVMVATASEKCGQELDIMLRGFEDMGEYARRTSLLVK